MVLDRVFVVSTPTSGTLHTDVMTNSCRIEIEGRRLKVDLILLDIKDFNIIIDIDWLVAQHAHVECFHKRVVFIIPNEESFAI